MTLSRARTAATVARLLPLYFAAGVLKHVVPLPVLARWAWRKPVRSRDCREQLRLVACVVKISRTIGAADRDCLQRSLLLYRELSHLGAEPELCVDLAPLAAGAGVRGHSWVAIEGKAVLDERAGLDPAGPLVRFGHGGRRLA